MTPLRSALWVGSLVIPLALFGCSVEGGITGDDPSGDDGDGPGGDGPDDPSCQQREPIELATGAPPDLLLVVDKSGSMADPLQGGQGKWPVMRGALDTVVGQYDGGINFGLMLYPQGNECDAGDVRAGIAPQNASAISAALNQTSPDGGTPTHTTLTAARTYFQGMAANPTGRYVLLATDGEPNCGSPNDFQQPTVSESLAAITALKNDSISTFVLGFGGNVNTYPETLEAMAQAGGTVDYFAANSPDELATALEAIASEVGLPSCTFRLDQTPGDLGQVTVYADATEVPYDPNHQQGWDYNVANNTITLYGQSCDEIHGGQTDEVRIEFGCDTVD